MGISPAAGLRRRLSAQKNVESTQGDSDIDNLRFYVGKGHFQRVTQATAAAEPTKSAGALFTSLSTSIRHVHSV